MRFLFERNAKWSEPKVKQDYDSLWLFSKRLEKHEEGLKKDSELHELSPKLLFVNILHKQVDILLSADELSIL